MSLFSRIVDLFERFLYKIPGLPFKDVHGRPVRLQRKYVLFFFFSFVGLSTIAVVFVTFPVVATSTSEFCSTCHLMEPYYGSWAQSSHAKTECIQCHVPPGTLHLFTHKITVLPMVYTNLFTTKEVQPNLVVRPPNENCLQCHTEDREVSVSGDLKIPHREHIEFRDLKCSDCHSAVVHGNKGSTRPSMDFCYMCHDGKRAPNQCSTCHTSQKPPPDHAVDIIENHGRLAEGKTEDCYRCHSPASNFCVDCHNQRPASHDETWRYTHSKEALVNKEKCFQCHGSQKYCNTCHQVDHPKDWVPKTHQEVAGLSKEPCMVCHSPNFCQKCHGGD